MSKDLLEQEERLRQAKAEHVQSLLEERERSAKAHVVRMAEIADELKALGWKPARAPRGSKTAPPPTESL